MSESTRKPRKPHPLVQEHFGAMLEEEAGIAAANLLDQLVKALPEYLPRLEAFDEVSLDHAIRLIQSHFAIGFGNFFGALLLDPVTRAYIASRGRSIAGAGGRPINPALRQLDENIETLWDGESLPLPKQLERALTDTSSPAKGVSTDAHGHSKQKAPEVDESVLLNRDKIAKRRRKILKEKKKQPTP